MFIRQTIFAAAAMTLAIPLAHAGDYAGGAVKSVKTDNGQVLTDAKGMTLYTFDKDAAGVSNCSGKCAANWPPLAAGNGATPDGDYTLIKRDDGMMQWAYGDMPLNLWKNDKAPGEMTGDGVGGVWHVAREK